MWEQPITVAEEWSSLWWVSRLYHLASNIAVPSTRQTQVAASGRLSEYGNQEQVQDEQNAAYTCDDWVREKPYMIIIKIYIKLKNQKTKKDSTK